MYKKFIATIALSFVASGCGGKMMPGDEYTVYIDPNFGDKIPLVVSGLIEWENASNYYNQHLKFDIAISSRKCEYDCGNDAFSIHSASIEEVNFIMYGSIDTTYGIGVTERDFTSSDIYVAYDTNAQSPDDMWHTTLLHEIGHALGLAHTEDHTLMYYTCWSNDDTCAENITCQDMQQIASVRNRAQPECNVKEIR